MKKVFLENTTGLTVAYIVRKVFTFFYFVLIARYAGLRVAGLFGLVLCYASIFYVAMDYGLTNYLIRENSKYKDNIIAVFNYAIQLKILLAFIGVIFTILVLNFLNYPSITCRLLYIGIAAMILKSFSATFFAYFRSQQNMQYEIFGIIIGQFFTLVFAIMAIYLHLNVYVIVSTLLVDGLVNIFISLICLYKRFRNVFGFFRYDFALIKRILVIALPFAMSGFIIELYSFDALIISKFIDEVHIAWYNAASRIIYSLNFIPLSVASALYPLLSSLHESEPYKTKEVFDRVQKYLLWFGVFLTVGIFLFAPKIIPVLYGAGYENSILILQIMSLALVFIFANHALFCYLNAVNRHNANLAINVVTIILHIVISIISVRVFGIVGVAASCIVSSLFRYLLTIIALRAKNLGFATPQFAR